MIVSIIENIVSALSGSPAPTFFSGRTDYQNLHLDDASMPVVMMQEPSRRESIKQSGAVFPTYKIYMVFGDQTSIDDLQPDLDIIIREQEATRREFLLRLSQHDDVIELTGISGDPFYNSTKWDTPISGWTLEANVEIRDASSICFEQTVETILCEAIENATAQEIADCLSPAKEAALEEIICPISTSPVSIIDQDENEIDTVDCGGEYQVTVLSILNGGTPSTVYSSTILAPPL